MPMNKDYLQLEFDSLGNEASENSPLPYMTANELHGEMRVRQRGRSKGETLYKHIRRIKWLLNLAEKNWNVLVVTKKKLNW